MKNLSKFRQLLLAFAALSLVATACGSDTEVSEPSSVPAEEVMEDDAMEDDAMEDDAMEDDAMEDESHDDDAMEDDAMEDDEG